MKVTIRTIAEEAGVSEATVSYVVNGKGNVSRVVSERIQAIIKKHGYRPRKRTIPSPAGTKHKTVAVVFPYSDAKPFHEKSGEFVIGPVLTGIEETLSAAGLSMSICTAATPGGDLPGMCSKSAVDGVISFWGGASTALPSVSVFQCQPGNITDLTQPDNHVCGAMAAERLASVGCKQCAVLNPRAPNRALQTREHAFLGDMASRGIAVVSVKRAEDVLPSPAEVLVDRLLSEVPETDGIFIPGADVNVASICMELQRRNRPPSDSLRVVACLSNIEYLDALNLGIDFIDIQLRAVGSAAAETLLWRLQHRESPYRRVQIHPRLIKK